MKEYCPKVFRVLRERLFRVSLQDYIREWLVSEENLLAKEGAGRSGNWCLSIVGFIVTGALFLFSEGKRFITKTIFHNEVALIVSVTSQ